MTPLKIRLKTLVQYCVILSTTINSINFYWSNELRIKGYIEQFKKKYTPSLIIEADKERSP